jgi:cytochrome P450
MAGKAAAAHDEHRFASDEVPLPAYLPPDTVKITEWGEVMEALRSPHLLQEPPLVSDLFGGSLGFINGTEHRQRRRAMNALVRPEPLQRYRTEVIEPTVRQVMGEMLVKPAPDAPYGGDLVPMLHKVFTQFGAAIIGLEGADFPGGRDALREVFRPFPAANNAKWLSHGRDAAIEAGLVAKKEYVEQFVAPSLAAAKKRLAQASSPGDPGTPPDSLLELVARQVDPAWEDPELGLRDAISFLVSSVETSTNGVLHLVVELSRWFDDHPEDYGLRSDDGFLTASMNEALRIRPNPPVLGRIAAEDITLSNGKQIKKGQRVAIYHTRASRDESVFGDDAAMFNPRRVPPEHVAAYGLSFGAGSHMCIGQRLVIGDGVTSGSHVQVVRMLFAAGVRADPEQPVIRDEEELNKILSYPALFPDWLPDSVTS